jgi:hypothetical protein
MNESEAVILLLENYAGPAVLVGFAILKGVAAVLNNNLSTKKWPTWIRSSLDWLASADKKGKETGDDYVDSVVEISKNATVKKAGKLVKLLKVFS